jgi:glutamate 5-kinase
LKQSAKSYKRIVIKIGSSLFRTGNDLDFSFVQDITRQIVRLRQEGREILLVSSGAIALGMSLLKLACRPKDLSQLQAVAAIGQSELMDTYRGLFEKNSGPSCAQVLLTWEDFDSRKRYLNAKNTLLTLLKLGSVPIINENDTVSTEEIKFGDNDRLSALVATAVSADLLVMLSDIDGLLGEDRKTVVRIVDEITPRIKKLACPTEKATSVGGMITKLEAARIAIDSGIPCVIANGRRQDIVNLAVNNPQECGTLFISKKNLDARERWIAFSTKPKGKIIVDAGAKNALLNRKSLLAVGVVTAEGGFDQGDIVSIAEAQSSEFARGRSNLSRRQLDKVKGRRFDKEVIHSNNIVIL